MFLSWHLISGFCWYVSNTGSFTTIYSDHKHLQHLSTMVNNNKRLMRCSSFHTRLFMFLAKKTLLLTLSCELGTLLHHWSLLRKGRCWAGLFIVHSTNKDRGHIKDSTQKKNWLYVFAKLVWVCLTRDKRIEKSSSWTQNWCKSPQALSLHMLVM